MAKNILNFHFDYLNPRLTCAMGIFQTKPTEKMFSNSAELVPLDTYLQESSAWLDERKMSSSEKDDLKLGNVCFVCTGKDRSKRYDALIIHFCIILDQE